MKTKTGEIIARQASAFIAATFDMAEGERPQHFSLPVHPIEGEDLQDVLTDLRENFDADVRNPATVNEGEPGIAEIIVYVAAVTVG